MNCSLFFLVKALILLASSKNDVPNIAICALKRFFVSTRPENFSRPHTDGNFALSPKYF